MGKMLKKLNTMRNEANGIIEKTMTQWGLSPLQIGFQALGGLRSQFSQAIFLDAVIEYVEGDERAEGEVSDLEPYLNLALRTFARDKVLDMDTLLAYAEIIRFKTSN